MAIIQADSPFPLFTDKGGDPLDGGFVYFGEPDLNPEESPKTVYYDAALAIATPQPLRTSNGYITRNGAPAAIYSDGAFSMTVRDRNSALVFYSPRTFLPIPDGFVLSDRNPRDVAALLANTSLSYTNVTAGDIIRTLAEGFAYEVAAFGATDHDVTTAGGVKLHVLPDASDCYNVKAYGAVCDGVADDTAFVNLATRAAFAHSGNDDLSMRRRILLPAGDIRIDGEVYVRKGQTLTGAGDGTTRVRIDTASNGHRTFILGKGLPGGVETADPGGLPPVIENLHTFGGDATGCVIDAGVAGQRVRNLFITSCGVGIRASGGDGIFADCIIDQGLRGVTVTGQNQLFSDIIFYNMNYGITVLDDTYDVQIADCHFEYTEFNDILFDDGATNIMNVSVADCQFIKNIQYATSNAGINFRSNNAVATIANCVFRNQRSYSIAVTSGIGNIVKVSDCEFNGLKTVPAYAQSTTAAGIDTKDSEFDIVDCKFVNTLGVPILVPHTFAYKVRVKDCHYKSLNGIASFVSITGSAGTVDIEGCHGDSVTPLVNTQSSIIVKIRGNVNWLGAVQTASSRRFWVIPTQRSAIVQVGIRANTNAAGNVNYRKATMVLASRHIDSDGTLKDFATESTIYQTPAGFAPVIDFQVDLDSVGGGASLAYSAVGRNLIVSVPDSYTDIQIEADFIA